MKGPLALIGLVENPLPFSGEWAIPYEVRAICARSTPGGMRTIIPNRKGVTKEGREERSRFSNGVVLAGEHLFFSKTKD